MAPTLPSLQRFAKLDSSSDNSEVQETVTAVIADLSTTVDKAIDPGKARKSIAELLDFLNSLGSTVNPGHEALKQSISQKIIPLLYQNSSEANDYSYFGAEYLLTNHICAQIGSNLAFVRGEVDTHPAFRMGRREDILPPLCVFVPIFASGLRDLITKLITKKFRTKKIETHIYDSLKTSVLDQGGNPDNFFKDNQSFINEQITELFDWAASVEEKLALRAAAGNPEATELQPEEILIEDLLLDLKIHSRSNEYFLPKTAGFKLLNSLYICNRKEFIRGIKAIMNAIKYGENHNYIVSQVDRLVNDIHGHDFDLIALSAYNVGDEESLMSFTVMQDACIGTATNREIMLQERPLVSMEIGRQPIHMAQLLIMETNKSGGSLNRITQLLNQFRDTVLKINKIRFEPEINISADITRSSEVLQPLTLWIQKDNAEEEAFAKRKKQVGIKLKKKWKL